jgi:hypothetical protein
VFLVKYYSGDQIKKYEVGGYVARFRDRRAAYRVLVGDPRERAHLEDLGVDGRIILKRFFEK